MGQAFSSCCCLRPSSRPIRDEIDSHLIQRLPCILRLSIQVFHSRRAVWHETKEAIWVTCRVFTARSLWIMYIERHTGPRHLYNINRGVYIRLEVSESAKIHSQGFGRCFFFSSLSYEFLTRSQS